MVPGSLVPWTAIWPSPPANSLSMLLWPERPMANTPYPVPGCGREVERVGVVEGAGRRRVLAGADRGRSLELHRAVLQQRELALGEATP